MTALAADKIDPYGRTNVVEITPEAGRPQNAIRRFSTADLSRHGGWLLKRLSQQYPGVPERSLGAYLYSMTSNNEYSFLSSDHGAALAQLSRSSTLVSLPIIREEFCWAENPQDKQHVAAAALFYGEWRQWATSMGVDVLIVKENTDVPDDLIEKQLGPLRKKPQVFARIGK